MPKIIVRLAVMVLRIINLVFYPLSLKRKVTIISRQSDVPTLDITLLKDYLGKHDFETVVLTKTLKKSLTGAVSYGVQMLVQMYHIATSKVVVLDGYCILVSILPKKKGQQVVQMWHALGAIKKFGWQNTENPDGHGREFSEIMCMHRNYDHVIAPGGITGDFFAEAFRTDREKIVYCGLPRIDFIREEDEELKAKLQEAYPSVKEKVNVLYVPTFRKNAVLEMEALVEKFDFESCNLIIKKHFLDKGDYSWAEKAGAIVDEKFTSLEWLKNSEKIVTDYSAIAFEAAVADKDIYIYQPDEMNYSNKVGLNMNLREEPIGIYVCNSEDELIEKLREPYNKDLVIQFRNKYFEIDLDNCTGALGDFVAGLIV